MLRLETNTLLIISAITVTENNKRWKPNNAILKIIKKATALIQLLVECLQLSRLLQF